MDANKVDLYLMANAKYFLPQHINYLRERLLNLDESRWVMLHTADIHDPGNVLLVSIFGGKLGIDRFMIGDTGLGIGKLLTLGGCGIWWLVDLFLIKDATKERNMQKVERFL